MINISVIGNLGYDCVVRDAGNECVIAFSIAHNEKWMDKDGITHEKTVWVSCSKWVREGNITLAQYLKKGTKVWVSGKPEINTYQTKSGDWVSDLKLTVEKLELLSSKSDKNDEEDKKEVENDK